MRTLTQGHSATCRCAKCRQAKALLSITQKMEATSENYADFEVEPFASFDTAAESPTWMGNELVDEQEAEYGRRRQPPQRGMQSRARPASRRVRRQPQGRRPRRVRRGPAIFAPEPAVIEAPQGSEHVRWLQNTLNQIMDLNLPVDGVMGVETRSAIRSFQERQGLPVDGTVGPETKQALIGATRGGPPAPSDAPPAEEEQFLGSLWGYFTGPRPYGSKPGQQPQPSQVQARVDRSSREYIQWVQRSLNKILGLQLAEDGLIGPMTRSAIRSFQQKYGLLVDGIVGPPTEGALITAGAGNPPGSGASPYLPSPTPTQPPTATGSRAQLAQQILSNSRITLDTRSTTPNGNPRQNILDTANGLPATSGCYDFSKCGSTVYLSTKMLQALLTLANDGNSFHVTSFAGGKHSSGSDHYLGRAVDIGIWNGKSLSSPNSAHTAARNALIAAGSSPSQTFNAYNDPKHGHDNHVHAAFY